jgi:DJ-1 family protein
MVYTFFANGFEEIEALAPVDMLRRAGIEVVTVGIGGRVVNGGHDIVVTMDIDESQMHTNGLEAIILPGGLGGTEMLDKSEAVHKMIDYCMEKGVLIAAICAAPSILGKRGLLKGKKATAYPTFQKYLTDANISDEYVCRSGNIITARGMGVSLEFSAEIIATLKGPKIADEILEQIQCPK